MFVICHVRLLVGIQFRFATVHSSVTQPEAASIGSVLPRERKPPSRPWTATNSFPRFRVFQLSGFLCFITHHDHKLRVQQDPCMHVVHAIVYACVARLKTIDLPMLPTIYPFRACALCSSAMIDVHQQALEYMIRISP